MQVFTGLYDSTDNVFGGVIAGGRHFRKWTIPAMVPATTCVAATTALTGTINFGSATLKASTTATVIMNSGVGTLKKDFGYAIFEFDAALGLSASTADTVYTTSGSVRLLAFNWIIVTQTNTETAIDGVAFSFSGITTPHFKQTNNYSVKVYYINTSGYLAATYTGSFAAIEPTSSTSLTVTATETTLSAATYNYWLLA